MQRIKQVILIRKDLKMRRGKEIAQGAHASMAFLCRRISDAQKTAIPAPVLPEIEQSWINSGMAKVCLQVQSEQELLHYYRIALDEGLSSELIQDSGRTEFGGVPTYTACAIGPDSEERIDGITGDLKLY